MPVTSSYLSIPLFTPPAPGCQVTISFAQNSRQHEALFDSGADRTFIPADLVSELALRKLRDIDVTGATGTTEKEGLYYATLEFLGFRLFNHPVVSLTGRSYIIIGRDIMNRYSILLDGPNLQLTLT